LEILFFVLLLVFRHFPVRHVKISLPFFLLLACLAASAQAASFDCVAPVFPDHSTSNEGVRRIEKQVRQWRACNVAHRSESVDVDRLNAEVDASLAKWIAATRAYANGQLKDQRTLTQMEREKVDYGMWIRGTSLPPAATSAGKF
jgi:hypothetical protein